ALAASLALIPDGDEKTNGISVGQQTAAGMVALRANDGRNNVSTYTAGSGLGVWVPTPPGLLPAATPWVRFITPWSMNSPSQFRSEPPPALDSEDWVNSYNDVKAVGGATSSERTVAQLDVAQFWT